MLPYSIAAVAIVVAVALPGSVALASSPPDACCACIETLGASLNGMQTPPPSNPALFCGEFSDSELEPAGMECAGLGGKLLCLAVTAQAATISDECRALLAEENIACSSPAGAPLAGGWTLLALAGLLGLAGVLAARRAAR